jgi:glutamate-ammonia-ligase adenylyltransferase
MKNRNASELKAEIYQMRLKMYDNSEQNSQSNFDIKNSKGGLIDIEFFVQYFILLYAKKYPSLIENKGNLALIDDLASLKLIKKTEADSLSKAYRMYRNMIHQFSLNNLTTFTTADADMIKMADQIHLYFQRYLGNI